MPQRGSISGSRPLGITVLCVLYGIQVPIWIVLGGASIAFKDDFPVILVLPAICFICLAGVSAIGMWSGEKWGWWTGALRQLLNTCDALSLFFLFHWSNATMPILPYLRFAAIPVVSGLIFVYFFSDDVLVYFGRSSSSKILAIAMLLAGCIAIESIIVGVDFMLCCM
jgi:hypothetical protein